jgi:hypothetical protein
MFTQRTKTTCPVRLLVTMANKRQREVLEKMQMKAVGMISGLKGKSYEERCTELGLETLETRRIKQNMTLVYKLYSNVGGGDMFT